MATGRSNEGPTEVSEHDFTWRPAHQLGLGLSCGHGCGGQVDSWISRRAGLRSAMKSSQKYSLVGMTSTPLIGSPMDFESLLLS